jgi:hypothetical protein
MPTSVDAEKNARFVFKGTVRRLAAATLSELKPEKDTVVVRVDQMVRASEALRDFIGRDITVQLASGETVKSGEQAVFYTNGWLFGESLAVKSVGHRPVDATAAAVAAAGDSDPTKNLKRHELESRLDSADVVVSGTVTKVSVVEGGGAGKGKKMAIASGLAGPLGPISEHNPMWREATVRVATVHKGQHGTKTVTIRFPASTDVKWHKAVKLHPGQEGYFILHKGEGQKTKRAKAIAAGIAGAEEKGQAFTALSPLDFQPYDVDSNIKTLITGNKP